MDFMTRYYADFHHDIWKTTDGKTWYIFFPGTIHQWIKSKHDEKPSYGLKELNEIDVILYELDKGDKNER